MGFKFYLLVLIVILLLASFNCNKVIWVEFPSFLLKYEIENRLAIVLLQKISVLKRVKIAKEKSNLSDYHIKLIFMDKKPISARPISFVFLLSRSLFKSSSKYVTKVVFVKLRLERDF